MATSVRFVPRYVVAKMGAEMLQRAATHPEKPYNSVWPIIQAYECGLTRSQLRICADCAHPKFGENAFLRQLQGATNHGIGTCQTFTLAI
jgi:hypothetical protein